MSPAFTLFYEAHLSVVEGGVVDHPSDPGGHTWYGISQRFLERVGMSGPLTKDQAKQLAYDHFWGGQGLDQMDPVAAWCYCDALFNHPTRAAGRIFQYALGVRQDGMVGVKTRAAAQRVDRRRFVERYRLRRTRYYVAIVKHRPASMDFLVGWIERIHVLNQAMLVSGLFAQDIEALPWSGEEPDRVLGTGSRAA